MFTILLWLAIFIVGLVIGTKKAPSFKAKSDGLYLEYNSEGIGSVRQSKFITSIIKS